MAVREGKSSFDELEEANRIFLHLLQMGTCGGSGSDCTRSVWGKLVQELAERRAIKCGNRQFFCAEYRKFKSRFAESTENQRQESDITIDTSVYTGEGNQTTYNSTMKLSVVMGARTADIFVCDKETFATYDQDGVFLSVEELMGSEFCEEHAEEVGENYMLANQSKLAEEYGIVGYEDAYIGVFSYTEHREHAKAFVEFLFE